MDLIKESSVTESPDITSIIAAFEAKENPIELFFKEEFRSLQYLEEKLNLIDGKIEDIREWLNCYYPHMRLDALNYKRCLTKLTEIEDKVIALNDIYRRKCHTNDNPFSRFNYKVACAQCEAQFHLRNTQDLSNLENHKHAVDILSPSGGPTPKLQFDVDLENTPLITKPKYIIDDFPIQSISNIRHHYRCLLCQVLFRGKKSLRSHVYGKSHTKKLNNVAVCSKIGDFVKYFEQLPEAYQVFQVLFDLASQDAPSHLAFCTICAKNVPIENIPAHVTGNQTHRLKFQLSDYSFLNGYQDMMDIIRRNDAEIFDDPDEDDDAPQTVSEHSENNVASTSGVKSTVMNTSNSILMKKLAKKNKRKHKIIPSYTGSYNDRPVTTKDLVPHRLKNHLRFIEDVSYSNDIDDVRIVCTLCKFTIENSQEIVSHIVSEQHKLKSRLDFNETLHYYCYYCCLCCKYFKKDVKWLEHLNSVTHKQKESLMPKQTIQTVYKEYECINCSLIWYGQQHSINAHKKDKFGSTEKRWKPKDITLSHEIAKLLKDEAAFKADIQKASKESRDVLNSIASAEKCCRAIEDALCFKFGDQIRAYPFGSRISGLGNIASDLDVFVDIGSMYEGTIHQDAQFQSYCVQQTAHALRRHRDFTDVCPIPQARTPIVQVFHKRTDLDCDLSFRHGLSIENTEFLRFCINVQPKLKSLILFLKKWIRMNKFRDRISTYGVSLMSIYMMQSKGHLPSLAKLRQIDPQQSKIIAGWETFNFKKPISDIQLLFPLYENNERYLLAEFFEFYVNFDYEKQVICPLLGRSVSKDYFLDVNGSGLPKEMISYVNKIQANEDNEKFKITNSICLQDPFDLSHNVTKALPIEVLVKMIILMKQSYQLLHK